MSQTTLDGILSSATSAEPQPFTVKVGQLPGTIKPVKALPGATVRAVVQQAGLNTEGYEVRVDNQPVNSLDAPVFANQTVLLLRPVRGNTELVTVKVGQLPGTIKPVKIPAGSSVTVALAAAGLNADGYEVRIDNQPIGSFETPVYANQTVLLLRPVRGN